ncbi:MAG: prephenate dehydratase [Micrococcaceae bacterium]
MKKYVYLGPEGTFTEQALLSLTEASEVKRTPLASVTLALDAVIVGDADAAMVPIENSVEGGVNATLDAIAAVDGLRILREVLVQVRFSLVTAKDIKLEDVKTIATHGHAWAQCRAWVETSGLKVDYLPAASTAAAAASLTKDSEIDAAICSPQFAKDLGLKELATDIGEHQHAITRFVLIGKSDIASEITGHDKTTIVVPLPTDHPGALMELLTIFASRGINLTRLESRPQGDKLGRYSFSIDAEGHYKQARMADALQAAYRLSQETKFIGSYPRASKDEVKTANHHLDVAYTKANQWYEQL